MPHHFSCPFCGLELASDPYHEEWSRPRFTRVRPWFTEIRGIYLADASDSSIAITGLGIRTYSDYFSAPRRNDLSYLDFDKNALKRWNLGGHWCFGFHESCWKVLLLRLGLKPGSRFQNEAKKAVAKSVYYHLRCTPWPEPSSFAFDRNWPGPAQVNELSKYVDYLTSPFYADPWEIPSEEDLEAIGTVFRKKISDGLQRMRLTGTCPPTTSSIAIDHPSSEGTVASELVQFSETTEDETRTKSQELNRHLFGPLSPELGLDILSYLPFEEVLGLRLVCRDAAMLAAPDTLPRSYWRSRFRMGEEYDFLFLKHKVSRDWSSLAFGTRMALNTIFPVVNRRRIRRLLEPIAALVEL